MQKTLTARLRRLSSLFILLACVSLLPAPAALSAARYEPLPPQLDGSMMPYDFSAADSAVIIPDGFRPVAISYVARHGARFLSSHKKIAKVEKALYDAALEGRLSAEGDAFFALLRQIADSTGRDWGLLSPVGIREEKRLGADMARRFPNLFKGTAAKEISTFVPRVIMTMYEFNHSLEIPNEHLQISTLSGHCNDSLLYSFAYFPELSRFRDSGAWKEIYDEFVEKNVSPDPAMRLFTSTPFDSHKLKDLTMEIYGILQGCRAAGFAPPTSRWISPEEYYQCWRASNLKHYLRNTPNPVNPYSAPGTAPLIRRIIADADASLSAALSNHDAESLKYAAPVVLNGYFGHAETLLPLFSTMNLPGCFAYTSDYEILEKEWQLQTVTPLAANLEIIFLAPENGPTDADSVLVALRLNGRNIAPYPGASQTIDWKQLKEYWIERIASLTPA